MLIFSFFFGLGSIPLMSHTFLKKIHFMHHPLAVSQLQPKILHLQNTPEQQQPVEGLMRSREDTSRRENHMAKETLKSQLESSKSDFGVAKAQKLAQALFLV